MALLGAAAWGGALAGQLGGAPALAGATVLAAAIGLLPARAAAARGRRTALGWAVAMLIVTAAVGGGALLRERAVEHNPVRGLAEERVRVVATGTVTNDPRLVEGPFGDQSVVRIRVGSVEARGVRRGVGATVVILGDPAWQEVRLGATVRAEGRLAVPDDPRTAALMTGAAAPTVLEPPDVWWRASGAVRAAIRDAVAGRPPAQRGLVPALVDGDDAALPAEVEQQFRTTGLTHLTAVSGTNLTLLVGFLLLVARAVGVRGRWLQVVGLLGIVGFILLARTEPSVLRAAAMGTVGLFVLGTDGRRRGLRALGASVVVLLLLAPGLAVTAGFALSVLATAGIILLVPSLHGALERWMPAPVAMAIAVPLAAQLACTPIVAALSGEVSLVAVLANLLAGPAVGPATVLGLAAGLVGVIWPGAGTLLGTLAGWCVGWIIVVAERGAALPAAAIGWGTGGLAIVILTLVCLAAIPVLPWLLRRRRIGVAVAMAVLLVVLGLPTRLLGTLSETLTGASDWPPSGWAVAACDVGQGDAIAVATGRPGEAVVIDAGPDPAPVDRCLDRLGVERIPLLVLSHFHADHVDGLDGVLAGRAVGLIEVTPVLDPPDGVAEVRADAADAEVPVAVAPFGSTRAIGDARIQVLAPDLPQLVPGAGDGTSANDASVVLLVETAGLRLLATGDLEPPGQATLAAAVAGLRVDVLKVPHHGSRHQDHDWLTSLEPQVALVSAGAENDYGHPAPETVDALQSAGTDVVRTDESGSIALVPSESGIAVVTER
ncbi:MBL fold metallo-hydrolase [Nocardioides sp. BGMRC 2183]|nr:MBL fold metallo-hydrolase [Nocardioides sp. BGMRC 2183]